MLKPNGEFLLEIVNPDLWVKVMMPIPHVGLNAHFKPDPARWRAMLKDAGFEVIEEGTAPGDPVLAGAEAAGSPGCRDQAGLRTRARIRRTPAGALHLDERRAGCACAWQRFRRDRVTIKAEGSGRSGAHVSTFAPLFGLMDACAIERFSAASLVQTWSHSEHIQTISSVVLHARILCPAAQ